MGSYHAAKSPSSAYRWATCTASVGAQVGIPNTGNDAARLGTCGHQMHAELLEDPSLDPQSYLGREMAFWEHPESDSHGEDWTDALTPDPGLDVRHTVTVDQDLIDAVMASVNYVRNHQALHGGELLVEKSVPIGHFTGEEGATGSSDVILLGATVLDVMDLKLGRHKVYAYEVITPTHKDVVTGEVVPEVVRPNLQMACYALGALEEYGLLGDFQTVRMTILQPFVGHISEFSCTVEELLEVRDWLSKQARECDTNPTYRPSASACHYCRASGNCSAQTQAVISMALDGFEDVDTATPKVPNDNTLGSLYAALPIIADWSKAVEARVRDRLTSGHPVVRNDGVSYKLVEGKNLARTWTNADEAEATMKRMRLKADEMYTFNLISPTGAEKLAKPPKVKKGQEPIPAVLGKTQWSRLEKLIAKGQKGAPQIALETDPRPALAQATEGFEDVPVASSDADDLLS